MAGLITGIHHVTALAGNPQKNLDFYAGILGLRLVKKTVNFDAPEVYHFYYGDETGQPGSILTFFPYGDIMKGRHGKGMLNTTTFSVPISSLDFWQQRLKKFNIQFKQPQQRFTDEAFIYFEDEDGLGLELVFNDKDTRKGFTHGSIPLENSIKGFYNVEIWEEGYERTAAILTEQLDHVLIAEQSNRFRFAATNTPGNYVDILCAPDSLKGLSGGGTIHHIAFATANKQTQEEVRIKMAQRMLNPTPILDRQYFTSIYFREPGGVLFEVATAGPGFTIDEDKTHLGEALKLPEWFEPNRKAIEQAVVPVFFNAENFCMMHTKKIFSAGTNIGEAKKALVMIHGRGAFAEDILSLAGYFNLNNYALIAPQAENNTWYPYSFLASPKQNEPWLSSALNILSEVVSDINNAGIANEHIYFLGFSQGACLMLEFVTRNAKKYGGIVAFTGGLIGDKIYSENYSGDFLNTPVFIGSSNPDPHVPVERVNETGAILKNMHADLSIKIYPGLGHTINKDEIQQANDFIFNDKII